MWGLPVGARERVGRAAYTKWWRGAKKSGYSPRLRNHFTHCGGEAMEYKKQVEDKDGGG